jgi:hypothetical protein
MNCKLIAKESQFSSVVFINAFPIDKNWGIDLCHLLSIAASSNPERLVYGCISAGKVQLGYHSPVV